MPAQRQGRAPVPFWGQPRGAAFPTLSGTGRVVLRLSRKYRRHPCTSPMPNPGARSTTPTRFTSPGCLRRTRPRRARRWSSSVPARSAWWPRWSWRAWACPACCSNPNCRSPKAAAPSCSRAARWKSCSRSAWTARITASGLPWRFGNSFYRGQRVFRMEAPHDPDDRFFPMINLQQQYLEQYLTEAVLAHPLIDLRWGNRVTRVRPQRWLRPRRGGHARGPVHGWSPTGWSPPTAHAPASAR